MFCYNSIQLYDTKFNKNRQTDFREFFIVARVWAGETKATLLAVHFAKRNTKNCGSDWISEFSVRIFVKKVRILSKILILKTGGERGMNFPLESFKPFELPLAGFALRGFESAYFIDYSYLIGNSVLTGGERGIRTLGTSIRIYIRLAGERLRPARPSLH